MATRRIPNHVSPLLTFCIAGAIAEDSIMSGATGAAQAKTTGNANGHLEVAARNLQAYCNGQLN